MNKLGEDCNCGFFETCQANSFSKFIVVISYRKIRKISPGAYIFQRPFFEGLIFGGAYVRREICVSKSIGLACIGKEIYRFCFVLLCVRGKIPSTSPPGDYIRRGDLTEGFLRYDFGGLFSEFYGIMLERQVCLTPCCDFVCHL